MTEGRFARWSKMKTDKRNKDRAGRGRAAPVDLDEPTPLTDDLPEWQGDQKPSQEVAHLTPDVSEEGGEQAERINPDDLPEVEDLDENSDYSAFMQDDVPEEKQRAALNKLWRVDPGFNFRDGLDDYDEDFTIVEAIAETVYKVGKGMLGDGNDEVEPTEAVDAKDEGSTTAVQNQNVETAETLSGESLNPAKSEISEKNGNDFQNDSNEGSQEKAEAAKSNS